MSALNDLTDRLRSAAANPPRLLQDKVIADAPNPVLPPTTSTGARRAVIRPAMAQRSQIRSQSISEARDEARRSMTAEARKEITG